jgi:hypothetical protein
MNEDKELIDYLFLIYTYNLLIKMIKDVKEQDLTAKKYKGIELDEEETEIIHNGKKYRLVEE